MKLSALTPLQQGQLAVAIAEILTCGVTSSAEIDAISLILSAVRDNVLFYGLELKKNTGANSAGNSVK